MKNTRIIALLVAIGVLPVALASCGGDVYGEPLSGAETVRVAAILDDPAAYDGETVKLEGEIGNECPTGCWFELRDDGASIHVDIAPHGLAIPQRQGSGVTVEGTVRVTDARVMLIGEGVETR